MNAVRVNSAQKIKKNVQKVLTRLFQPTHMPEGLLCVGYILKTNGIHSC